MVICIFYSAPLTLTSLCIRYNTLYLSHVTACLDSHHTVQPSDDMSRAPVDKLWVVGDTCRAVWNTPSTPCDTSRTHTMYADNLLWRVAIASRHPSNMARRVARVWSPVNESARRLASITSQLIKPLNTLNNTHRQPLKSLAWSLKVQSGIIISTRLYITC